MSSTINISEWIQQNKESFLPPVCNKLLCHKQLKVMFVGGPNVRKDYHIEEGEELFYQLQGDMCLKIIEKGKPKDIHIKEGEMFVLPSKIPHSPQRQSNTIGLVIERERSKSPEEIDGLRWYCDDSLQPNSNSPPKPLYEEWFFCEDLGVQLAPVMHRFFESDEWKTGTPQSDNPNKSNIQPSFQVDEITPVDPPIHLESWIKENTEEITNRSKFLYSKGEFKIQVFGENDGNHECVNPYCFETWFWQIKGQAEISLQDPVETISLDEGHAYLLPPGKKYCVKRSKNSVGLVVTMQPTHCNYVPLQP